MKKHILLSLLLIISSHSIINALFTTLPTAQTYIETHPEYVEIDNQDWLNPNFSSYHKSMQPGMWDRMLMRLGIKQPTWEPTKFKTLVESLITSRELNGYTGRFVLKMTPLPGTKYIIWGDLHGAFHSLVRDLNALKKMGAIDDNLKVREPYYFIFNGNVIDGSPYVLETLSFVMQLMHINPDRVIYIQGTHEDKQRWHDFGLARELNIKCAGIPSDEQIQFHEHIPLSKKLTRFFNTLPIALYLRGFNASEEIDVVRISYYGRDFTELNETEFAGFLEKAGGELIQQFNLGQEEESEKEVQVKAIVRGEDRTVQFKPNKGLIKLEVEKESTAWAVLSSPIGAHRREYDFFYDSFTQITTAQKIDNWIIEFYHQDVRRMIGFKQGPIYNLLSGLVIKQEATLPGEISVQQQMQNLYQKVEELDEKLEDAQEELEKLKKEGVPAPAETVETQPKEKPETKEEPEAKPEPEKKAEPKKKAEPEVKPKAEQKPEAKKEAEPTPQPEPKSKEEPEKEKTAQPEPKPESIKKPQKKGDEKEITLGSAIGLTRGLGPAGKAFADGIQLRINEAREAGGINGIIPRIIVEDDQYDPPKTREIIENFLADGIDIILSPPGSPTLESYYDLIKEGKVLVLFPSTGIPEAHTEKFKYIIHLRGDDIFEGRALAEYAFQELKAKKAVLFIQDDSFGLALAEGAHKAMEDHKITDWVEIKHDRTKLNFEKQIEKIKAIKDLDTIIFLGITAAAQELVRQLGIENLVGKNLVGNSDFGGEEVTKFFTSKGLDIKKMSVVPNINTSKLEIVTQFKAAAKKAKTPLDAFTLESYIASDVALELMKMVKGPITKEKLIEVAEGLKNYEHKGLTLNFIPKKRNLSRSLWVDEGKDKDWKQIKEVDGKVVIQD
jgi:ABC-type branched-subunit amino acid transport system substrate-binding protein